MAELKAPPRLAAAGRRLWRDVVDVFELRADELQVLEKACRTADDSRRLDMALIDADLMVKGSTGQLRANPLLHEARQTRALLAALLKQLGLPDEQATVDAQSQQRSVKAVRAPAPAGMGADVARRRDAPEASEPILAPGLTASDVERLWSLAALFDTDRCLPLSAIKEIAGIARSPVDYFTGPYNQPMPLELWSDFYFAVVAPGATNSDALIATVEHARGRQSLA